ncbi:MAG: anti-sigma factor [Gammaproteobacteria bacterium]|uniref:Sigma factor AlgU negative regulatory protein n=1 Tax=Marinobacter litoralis TaxID=187981 RepID=A0A3M2RJM2_9GAMM|nr:RseA family anti-sigma factor [Marinobacter litoralis]MBR9869806.1 anti-sigma factor [Gammaproteobacteria bacterium]RMJ05521.1 Sigma factor AlgU negative regulatory protein [Marinobacter litoralis]
MDERLRETLSAMMDDEADELSVRRLLSHDDQNEVREQWQRWQQVRDLMHEAPGTSYGVDVAGAVRAAIDDQEVPAVKAAATSARAGGYWHWPVAAMVTLALLVGFGAGAGWGTSPGEAGNALALNEADKVAPQLLLSTEEVALQRLDEQQLRQVRQYLLEHAQHNSVGAGRGSMGYARMVSANGGY